jgi:hypothetical protein
MLTTLVESDQDSILKKLLGDRKPSEDVLVNSSSNVFSIPGLLKRIKSNPFSQLQKLLDEGFDINRVDTHID